MSNNKKAWSWIPSLYFAEGLPYVLVMTVSVIMYKKLNLSNTEIALYTSWLYLPWVIKPFWSPIVDILKTKRWWIVLMQLVIGVALAGIAFTIPTTNFLQYTLAFFWLMAFSSATHDIAADGFYMIGLSQQEQTFFVGIRNTFYRISMLAGQGLLVMLAGYFEEMFNDVQTAWSLMFGVMAVLFVIFSFYHKFALPKPITDVERTDAKSFNDVTAEIKKTFVSFFKKKNIWVGLTFLLIYRLGESQLVKLASPFLLDSPEAGGLGLTTKEIGFAYGTMGMIFLTLGGILGGVYASKHGLKKSILLMTFFMNIPNLVYVYFALFTPTAYWQIVTGIAIEQFGYGFGFTAYMLYMIYISEGEYKTAHYSFCTGFMALGMMLPGMVSGWLQETIGYSNFFIWVVLCTIPGFIMLRYLKIDPLFGLKNDKK